MKYTVFNSKQILVVVIFLLIIMTTGLITACATEEPVITADMSEEDYFKSAQAASDKGNYNLALAYYYKFKETYPDNLEKNTWASYEIAFLYHKMGDEQKSLELFNELLTLYSQDKSGVLPRTVKALAETVVDKIKTRLAPPAVQPEK